MNLREYARLVEEVTRAYQTDLTQRAEMYHKKLNALTEDFLGMDRTADEPEPERESDDWHSFKGF